MNTFEFECRNLFYAYQEGRYNSAELIYFVCHALKSYDFYHNEVKSLMNIIRNSVKEARWRDDLYIYDEQSRHTRFSFLGEYDSAPYWSTEEAVIVGDSPVIASYRPIDVINAINKHWSSIYDHPYLYVIVTYLLEATTNMTTPPNFEAKIKYFIYKVGRLYDEAQRVTQDDSFNESAYAWIGNLTAAHDSAREGKGSVQRPVEGR